MRLKDKERGKGGGKQKGKEREEQKGKERWKGGWPDLIKRQEGRHENGQMRQAVPGAIRQHFSTSARPQMDKAQRLNQTNRKEIVVLRQNEINDAQPSPAQPQPNAKWSEGGAALQKEERARRPGSGSKKRRGNVGAREACLGGRFGLFGRFGVALRVNSLISWVHGGTS